MNILRNIKNFRLKYNNKEIFKKYIWVIYLINKFIKKMAYINIK